MSQDTAFAGGAQAGSQFDPIYDTYQQAPLQEAQDQEDALPRGYYLVQFEGGKGSFTKDETIPQVRLSAEVILGGEGTVGRKVFGSLKFGVSKFDYQNNDQGVRVKVQLTNEKWQEAGREAAADLKRVATVLGLLTPLPNRDSSGRPTAETLAQYASQFAGKRAVIFIGSLPGRDDFGPSNYFKWDSIRGVNEEVRDKAGVILAKTATEFCQKKIEMAAARARNKAGKAAPTATPTQPAGSAADFS